MRAFAQFIHQELKLTGDPEEIRDICEGTDRYCMYKVGPVLSISVSMNITLYSTFLVFRMVNISSIILFFLNLCLHLHRSMAWVFLPSPSCCTSSSNCCTTLSAGMWSCFVWEHLAESVRNFVFFTFVIYADGTTSLTQNNLLCRSGSRHRGGHRQSRGLRLPPPV